MNSGAGWIFHEHAMRPGVLVLRQQNMDMGYSVRCWRVRSGLVLELRGARKLTKWLAVGDVVVVRLLDAQVRVGTVAVHLSPRHEGIELAELQGMAGEIAARPVVEFMQWA